MDRIASPLELSHHLRKLLAYSEGQEPSRELIAEELSDLADRVARLPAERWLPAEARGKDPLTPEGTDLAIWSYELGGNIYAIGFAGNQSKPYFHTRYRTEAQRSQSIESHAKARRGVMDLKQERQEARKQYKHDFKVGDILVSSWGYDQTNIDYYEVTKIIGEQMVEIREIGKKFTGSSGQQDIVMPDPGKYAGPATRKRVGQGGYVRLTSFSSASKWDGKPDYQTNSMFGH